MIIERKSGRSDTGLCCPDCGRSSLWQPADFSPCLDNWWCQFCRHFWSQVEVDYCGYGALMRPVPDSGASYPTMMRPACGGPDVPIQRRAA
jgi:hypothetical protein